MSQETFKNILLRTGVVVIRCTFAVQPNEDGIGINIEQMTESNLMGHNELIGALLDMARQGVENPTVPVQCGCQHCREERERARVEVALMGAENIIRNARSN